MDRKKTDVLILGGGIAGLSLAASLRCDWLLAERERQVGGLCRSVKIGRFLFDYTGHLLHFRRPEMLRRVKKLFAGDLPARHRQAFIRWRTRQIPYPFQAHLGALSPKTAAACWRDYQRAPGGTFGATISFHRFIRENFGVAMGRHFFYPYNRKLLRIAPERLASDWVGPFLPRPSAVQVRRGLRGDELEGLGYNPLFYYPPSGGIGALPRLLAAGLERRRILRGWEIAAIYPQEKRAVTRDGREVKYRRLVSTLPLPELLLKLSPLPEGVRQAARRLRYVGVLCASLGLRCDNSEGRSWIYLPGGRSPFYRLGFQNTFSSSVAPRGGGSLYLERTYRPGQKPGSKTARREALSFLRQAGYLGEKERVEQLALLDIPYAYVVYDLARQASMQVIREYTRREEIRLLGRYGAWEYSAMEDALYEGGELGEKLNKK